MAFSDESVHSVTDRPTNDRCQPVMLQRKLTDAQVSRVIEMYADPTVTLARIQEETGVSRGTIYYVIDKHRVPRRAKDARREEAIHHSLTHEFGYPTEGELVRTAQRAIHQREEIGRLRHQLDQWRQLALRYWEHADPDTGVASAEDAAKFRAAAEFLLDDGDDRY